jgi:hypothetical protein
MDKSSTYTAMYSNWLFFLLIQMSGSADKFLHNFLCRNLGLAPVLKKYTGYQIYQYEYNRRTSTLVSIYVTQDKYNRRTSTLILCKHVIGRAQQENKRSATKTKHKTSDNDDNQTLYATTRDRLRKSNGHGVTEAAVLVAKPPFRNEFLLTDRLQREKIGFTSSTDF